MAGAKEMRWLAPEPFDGYGFHFSATNATLDATDDGVAWVFAAGTTNAITHVGFRYGARTGTPPTYVITLESPVATTGLPDGTDVGGGSPTATTFTPPADATWDGTWQWIALTNSYTPTRDQKLALTIRHSSGTVNAGNNSTFTRQWQGNIATSIPYPVLLTAGTWAIIATATPLFGIRTASERFGHLCQSAYVTRSASTVGHRVAMKFTIPTDWCSTFKVKGVRCYFSYGLATGKNPILGLWSASAAIQTSTQDYDMSSGPTTAVRPSELFFDEGSLTALSAGTVYYVGIEVADAANGGVYIQGNQLSEANDLLAFPGGTSVHLATYNGTTWSDDQTVRPLCELILDDITAPSGGTTIAGTPMRRGMV